MLYEIQGQGGGEHNKDAYFNIDTTAVACVKSEGTHLTLYLKGGGAVNVNCYSYALAEQYRVEIAACMRATRAIHPSAQRYQSVTPNLPNTPQRDIPAPPPPTKDVRR